jgi:hypothetical protein
MKYLNEDSRYPGRGFEPSTSQTRVQSVTATSTRSKHNTQHGGYKRAERDTESQNWVRVVSL